MKRPYNGNYLARAKVIIDKAVSLLHAELVEHGRLGACVGISEVLFRVLEQEKIWSCCIKDSLTITFPSKTAIGTRYFWPADHGNFVAGHAWLYAPPYTVVDISVIPEIFDAFPAVAVPGLKGSWLKYSPVAIHAPEDKLPYLENMLFQGLTPWQLHHSQFAGNLLGNNA